MDDFITTTGFDKLVSDLGDRYSTIAVADSPFKRYTKSLSPNVVPGIDRLPVSARGMIIETDKGPLIDLSSQTVNTILGQNDPWVIAHQIAFQKSTFPSFLTSQLHNVYVSEVSSLISKIGGIKDAIVNLRICSGGGTIESLLNAAWQYRLRTIPNKTHKTKVGTFVGGFHGQAGQTAMISSTQSEAQLLFRFPGEEPPNWIPLGTPTHSSFDEKAETLSDNDAQILEKIRVSRDELFLVLIEPIMMKYGVITPSPMFLRELKKVCAENEILLGFDEVQTGCGWLGVMSAAERVGVAPNILGISKALTAGYGPLGATIAERTLPQQGGTGESTNGADLRALVAVRAIHERLLGIPADVIPGSVPAEMRKELEGGLLQTIPAKAEHLRSLLNPLTEKYSGIIGPLRGDRLIMGIPFLNTKTAEAKDIAKTVRLALMEEGVHTRIQHATLIIKPPAIITKDIASVAVEIMDRVFARLYKSF